MDNSFNSRGMLRRSNPGYSAQRQAMGEYGMSADEARRFVGEQQQINRYRLDADRAAAAGNQANPNFDPHRFGSVASNQFSGLFGQRADPAAQQRFGIPSQPGLENQFDAQRLSRRSESAGFNPVGQDRWRLENAASGGFVMDIDGQMTQNPMGLRRRYGMGNTEYDDVFGTRY